MGLILISLDAFSITYRDSAFVKGSTRFLSICTYVIAITPEFLNCLTDFKCLLTYLVDFALSLALFTLVITVWLSQFIRIDGIGFSTTSKSNKMRRCLKVGDDADVVASCVSGREREEGRAARRSWARLVPAQCGEGVRPSWAKRRRKDEGLSPSGFSYFPIPFLFYLMIWNDLNPRFEMFSNRVDHHMFTSKQQTFQALSPK